jgi:hypothetical protein
MLDLESFRHFDPDHDADFFADIPTRPGVYLLEPTAPNAQPYIARSADLRRAAQRLLGPPEPQSRRLNLREVIGGIRYRVTGSKFEQLLTLYDQARFHFPRRYRDFMRLRPPALLKVADSTSAHSPRAVPPRLSPRACWIFSKRAAARSRFAAIQRFPAAFIPR